MGQDNSKTSKPPGQQPTDNGNAKNGGGMTLPDGTRIPDYIKDWGATGEPTVFDKLSSYKEITTAMDAFRSSRKLTDILSDPKSSITVFVPLNRAFHDIVIPTGKDMELALERHIIPTRVEKSELSRIREAQTLDPNTVIKKVSRSIDGQRYVKRSPNHNLPPGKIVNYGEDASNGVFYFIDQLFI
ncbi:hypothetical protein H4219_003460 [Mycoemilia scoparia]|uniref:FAS1 domain-containing protein n=1 Tax=Mycoemilia scoparia TaxID=417184 RepID=A0A9W7ZUP2_9FUNG|nr:hypothetical protein H4219_003460 [Mycoemilia scoparia]